MLFITPLVHIVFIYRLSRDRGIRVLCQKRGQPISNPKSIQRYMDDSECPTTPLPPATSPAFLTVLSRT
jgi:hypothetical protein